MAFSSTHQLLYELHNLLVVIKTYLLPQKLRSHGENNTIPLAACLYRAK